MALENIHILREPDSYGHPKCTLGGVVPASVSNLSDSPNRRSNKLIGLLIHLRRHINVVSTFVGFQ